MYIIINIDTEKVYTFETKTDLSNYLGVHRNTITNKFTQNKSWKSEKGTVYKSDNHYKRLRRGNTGFNNRQ